MRRHAFVPAPELAHIVAIAVVPFSPPAARKGTDLVGAARIPSFGDDFSVAHDGVFCDRFDNWRVWKQIPLRISSENRPEVETEAIDMHGDNPISQAFLNERAHNRVVTVERVAAA